MHPRLLCALAVLGLVCQCAQAAPPIYQCHGATGPTFQDIECTGRGGRVQPEVRRATPNEVRAAREVGVRERRFVEKVEAERAQRQSEAAAERSKRDAERAELAKRCDGYEDLITAAQYGTGPERRSRQRNANDARRLEEAKARHFSECLGRR